jgi:ribosome-associated protein
MVSMTSSHSQTTAPPHHDPHNALRNAIAAARLCDQYRGQDTQVLDLTGITPLFDYFVISTATNRRQMHALADEVNRQMKEAGSPRLGREGYEGSSWVVEDYGDVVLHVFTPEARELYDLENLWGDAPHIDWKAESGNGDA